MKTTPMALQRKSLGLSQAGMAVLCGTSQSEISKAEVRGELPSDIVRWAKCYQWTVQRLKAECGKRARYIKRKEHIWSDLPLWGFFMQTPLEVQTVRCAPAPQPESVLTPEYAGEVLTRPTVDPVVIGMIAAKARKWRRA